MMLHYFEVFYFQKTLMQKVFKGRKGKKNIYYNKQKNKVKMIANIIND